MNQENEYSGCRQTHAFHESNPLAEKNTARAVVITAIMMVVEIVAGYMLNSMALLADGWHMSSHALALGLSVAAYALSRKLAHDTRFAFGTWKIEVLAGYTSAIFLLFIAGLMVYQSVERLISPSAIHYNEAIIIAAIGLSVNLLCAWLLKDGHHHAHHDHHDHGNDREHLHSHNHEHHHHDLNLRSAYIHVITDAATSVLAIFALIGGKLWGAGWLDPVMGIVGAALVASWSFSLLRDSGKVLLDAEMHAPVVQEIKDVIAASPIKAQISDLHVWRVGKASYACILELCTTDDASNEVSGEAFRQQLAVHEELVHITIEIIHPA